MQFYRLLGLDLPEDPADGHVEATMANGTRLMFDTEEVIDSFLPEWSARERKPGVPRVRVLEPCRGRRPVRARRRSRLRRREGAVGRSSGASATPCSVTRTACASTCTRHSRRPVQFTSISVAPVRSRSSPYVVSKTACEWPAAAQIRSYDARTRSRYVRSAPDGRRVQRRRSPGRCGDGRSRRSRGRGRQTQVGCDLARVHTMRAAREDQHGLAGGVEDRASSRSRRRRSPARHPAACAVRRRRRRRGRCRPSRLLEASPSRDRRSR